LRKQRKPASINDSDERRQQLYDEHRKQATEDIQTSSDDFDKNLLAVSSGALGFSLAFIKDIVHLQSAVWNWSLYASWICFAACIVITVFSFRLSIIANNAHLEYLYRYYICKEDKYLDKRSPAAYLLNVFTWAAAVCFMGGIILTVVFGFKNLGGGIP
jgi:hypothetical protein